MLMLIVQVVIGVYLKLHITKGFHSSIRRYVVHVHGAIGKVMPVVSWVQMLFGGITALGFCREDHLGQCLAHFIMGSAFIAYGIIMTILLLVGQIWLRRSGRSQEFFDSILITTWGIVNTFTEHRWGQPWAKNDIQHTTMGIVWWCAGLVGVWLSRSRGGRPKRNLVPGVVILLTGWAMGAHPQSLEISTMVHTVFGYTLMAAGATRLIEIAFVLKDSRGFVGEPNSFQYLPPFVSSPRALLSGDADDVLVIVCIWLPFHGCYRRADETSIGRTHYSRFLHPGSIFGRVPPLSLRQCAPAHLCRACVARLDLKWPPRKSYAVQIDFAICKRGRWPTESWIFEAVPKSHSASCWHEGSTCEWQNQYAKSQAD